MNWRAIRAIVRKDLKVVLQNKGVLLPMIIVPALFLVLIPLLFGLLPQLARMPGSNMSGASMQVYLEQMPPSMTAEMGSVSDDAKLVMLFMLYFIAPMYLILPMMVASVIAADSFAGEKERKTLEAILYTPTTDAELFLAKLLAPLLPATAVAWGGFLLLCVTANLGAWQVVGKVFFPNGMWIVLALWVAPAVAGLALGFTVLVSLRAKSFQEAYQMGALVVIPLVVLMIAQAAGAVFFSVGLALALGLALWLVNAGLLWYGSRTFKRGELIARL